MFCTLYKVIFDISFLYTLFLSNLKMSLDSKCFVSAIYLLVPSKFIIYFYNFHVTDFTDIVDKGIVPAYNFYNYE